MQKDAKVDGFRPGKVPLPVLQNMYGNYALREAVEHFVDQGVDAGLKKYDIKPMARPKVSVDQMGGKNADIELSFEVESTPNIPSIDFNNLEINDYKVADITPEELDQALEKHADENPAYKPSEAKIIKKLDLVYLSLIVKDQNDSIIKELTFEYDEQKSSTDKASSKYYGCIRVIAGGNAFPELAKLLLDSKVKIGESYSEDNFKFTEQYIPEKFRNIEYKITITPIALERPYKKLDAQYLEIMAIDKTLEDYSKDFKEDLLKFSRQESGNLQRVEIFDYIDEAIDSAMPTRTVDLEIEAMKEDLKAQNEEINDEKILTLAKRRVKLAIFINTYVEQNNLEIDQEELKRAIMYKAMSSRVDPSEYMKYLRENPQQVDAIKIPLLEQQAVKHIIDTCKKQEQTISYTELNAKTDEVNSRF
jgi:trigger factor